MSSPQPVRVRPYTWLVLGIGSLAGLAMFLWPLLTSPPAGTAHNAEAPFVFVLILPLVIAVVLAELSNGGLDVKAIAMLGLLSGVGAALRPLGTGTAGIETLFFLLILAGRVYGPGFGFVLGVDDVVRLVAAHRWSRARGCPSRCSRHRGWGWAPACCRGAGVGPRSRCSRCTARSRRTCSGFS